jgi:hypothetical protein
MSRSFYDLNITKPKEKGAKGKRVVAASMKAKTEKGMALLAAFEAKNIGGTGGRITVRLPCPCHKTRFMY